MTTATHALQLDPADLSYEEKKLAGWCTREGCRRWHADDSLLCAPCLRDAKQWSRASQQRRREARRAAKLCIWCPGDRPARATPGSTACLACRVKRRRIKHSDEGVKLDVKQDRSAQIAAATRRDPDGRSRYHGQQKRGQQPKAKLNLQDLRHARQDFEGFADGIELLANVGQDLHRGERERVEQSTASLGERMSGRMDDILERLGHFKQRHGRRDGDK